MKVLISNGILTLELVDARRPQAAMAEDGLLTSADFGWRPLNRHLQQTLDPAADLCIMYRDQFGGGGGKKKPLLESESRPKFPKYLLDVIDKTFQPTLQRHLIQYISYLGTYLARRYLGT